MGTIVTSRHVMKKAVRHQSDDIVGAKFVASGSDAAVLFSAPLTQPPGLTKACLAGTEEGPAIVFLTRQNKTSVSYKIDTSNQALPSGGGLPGTI